jgi:hypothetical protein
VFSGAGGLRPVAQAHPRDAAARGGPMTAAERFALFAGALSAALTLAVAGLTVLIVCAP